MVSAPDFHKAMTIFDYYVQRRFDPNRYKAGVSKDPADEIIKALDENKIKVFFICGEELADELDVFIS